MCRSTMLFVFFTLSLFVISCSNSPRSSYLDENNQVVVSLGDKEIKFESTEHISDAYRVLSLEATKNKLEKSNGVTFTLWGIQSDKLTTNGTFSPNDINKGEIYNMIPANDLIAEQIDEISNRKGCWKSVSITGDKVTKVSESGVLSELDLNFFYVSAIDVSF